MQVTWTYSRFRNSVSKVLRRNFVVNRLYTSAGSKNKPSVGRCSRAQRYILGSPSAGPGYCQKAARQSEEMSGGYADELVYGLIAKAQGDVLCGPRYRSKVCPEQCVHVHLLGCPGAFDERVVTVQFAGNLDSKDLCFGKREYKKFATMGLAKGIVKSRPEDFLRRNVGHTGASQGLHILLPGDYDFGIMARS